MKTVLKGLTMAALVAAVATPVEAQQKSWGFGLFGSWVSTGELAEAEPSDNDLKLDDDWSAGADLEWWFGARRVGLRFEGSYMQSGYVLTQGETDITDDDDILDPEDQDVLQNLSEVETWFADANLMLRLFPTDADRRFAPFVSAGTGLIHWDHEGDDVDVEFDPADAYIYGEDQTEWALTFGLGADIFFTESVALRLEAKDYWNSDSPYLKLSDMERDHEGGHNVMWRAGLQFNFGGARVEEPGFVQAPAPAPPVVAAPAPPATERVT
jgi:opacity protein-like surface antigen